MKKKLNSGINIVKNTFGKEEKLCNKVLISSLFSDGSSFFVHPFKINWMKTDKYRGADIQVLIVVSKRNFKKAVDRNRIKRLMRESYRLNKNIVYEWFSESDLGDGLNVEKTTEDNYKSDSTSVKQSQLLLSISYIGKTIPDYSDVEKKIILILRRLKKEYEENIG